MSAIQTTVAESLETLGASIVERSGGRASGYLVAHEELNITTTVDDVVELLRILRDDEAFRFNQLIDICGVDYPEREKRFDVVYHLISYFKNVRVRVKVQTDEDTPVPSVCPVYPSANWFERETFDMYGVFFSGHPDLRRILTDYGFHGYPLRKDFPMTGYVEVRWDEELKLSLIHI